MFVEMQASSGESGTFEIFPLSAISAGNQESSNPASNAANSLLTNRYSANYNQLTYLELTPYAGSVCVNAIYASIGADLISDCHGQDFTAKIQGYNGSSWVDIDTLSYTAAEADTRIGSVKTINNTTAYTKYRFVYQSYTHKQNSGTRQYCGMCFIELLNIS
jgi:hypothetical protein